jgi:hypothetical protein
VERRFTIGSWQSQRQIWIEGNGLRDFEAVFVVNIEHTTSYLRLRNSEKPGQVLTIIRDLEIF